MPNKSADHKKGIVNLYQILAVTEAVLVLLFDGYAIWLNRRSLTIHGIEDVITLSLNSSCFLSLNYMFWSSAYPVIKGAENASQRKFFLINSIIFLIFCVIFVAIAIAHRADWVIFNHSDYKNGLIRHVYLWGGNSMAT